MSNNVCVGKHYKNDNDRQFKCKYCGKAFTTSTSMYRHVNHTCKVKKQDEDEKSEIYRRLLNLEEENKLLKKEVVSLKRTDKTAKITNKTININKGVINNTTNQIILVGYGHEDLSKLSKNELIKILQSGYDSTLKLTEAVHFNPKYPEHHNIYISNMRDKYAMMFDGEKWTLTMKEDLINKIYDDKKNYIEENIEDFIDSLSTSRKKALDRWLDTCDEDDRISKIKNDIRLLLYNKRDLIMDKQEDNTHGLKKNSTSVKKITKKALEEVLSDDE